MPALIEDINRTYIQNPNSILLAISPANVDVANSDALRLAKEVDPQGIRTIGVFTKTDLIEDPNTIRKAFEGKAYPLKLGYYGVVCRSQNDISSRMSIPQALQKEVNYFKGSPHFQDYKDYCGISNLLFKLNRSLLEKIKETLPFIKETLKLQVSQKEESFQNFKRINDLVNSNEYNAILLNLVNTFKNNLTSALRGGSSNVKIKDKLFGGAKITLTFENEYHKKLFTAKIFDKIKDDEIYWTIKNSSGLQQAVFFNNEAFEELAKKQVVELKPPALECLNSVNEEIKNISKDILQEMKELQMFDRVGREIFAAVEDLMVKYYNEAKHAIELYFKVQAGCISQKHPGFVQTRNGVLEGSVKFIDSENRKSQGGFMDMFKKEPSKPVYEGNKDVATMKNLLIAYNNVLKHDSYDFVQKVIVSLFINEMLATVDQDLLSHVLRKGKAEMLCSVDRSKKDSFEKTENELRGLKQTLALLENVN
jgi:dynamin 1-like protein